MDLRALEMFLRVAELGSINKAAANLRMSQPTLSRHVAVLEHEMRCPLFTRTQAGVILTDAGRLLADRARPLLRQFTLMKEQVGERAAGLLAVGTPPAWQHLFTSRFVEMLTRDQPGISLRVHEGLSNVLRDYMFAGVLDLAVVPFHAPPPPGYAQTALVREPVVVVGSAADDLQPDTAVPITRLHGQRLVLPSKPNALRVQIEHALERKGLKFHLVVETDALSLYLDLARRGVGLTVIPASSLHGAQADRSIRWAPLKGQLVTWAVCENTARSHSPAVREGRKLLVHTIAQVVQSRSWPGAEMVGRGAEAARQALGGQ